MKTKRQVVIYCMSCSNVDFNLLPWDRMTYFNHAFWKVEKSDKGFEIVPCFPEYDFGEKCDNFKKLEQIHEKYSNVKIMLSVGGAGFCRYFSEMALKKEGRKAFIDSCINIMKKYSFLAGIDVDWEFPNITYKENNGCIRAGNDYKNYPILLKEMREAFDNEFGKGIKKLTVCAPAGEFLLANQGIPKFHHYVDLINIMSYDLDNCKKKAGHHTPLYSKLGKQSADKAVKIFKRKGVPSEKIVVGSPLYSHGCEGVKADKNGKVVGSRGNQSNFKGIIAWNEIKAFEIESVLFGQPGWHTGYDEKANGAYIFNDDKRSKYFGYYMSYESEKSLAVKIDYINKNNLGGIIVWEAGGDIHDGFPMITQMAKGLIG